MKQTHIVIIFIILIVLALVSAGANSLKVNFLSDNITPTPTEASLFNQGDKSNQNTLGAQKATPPNSQPQPTQISIKQYRQFPGNLAPEELKNKKATIETDKGIISFEIYPESTKAASNFIFLAKDGFYDGLIFHRIEDWVIQGGDPTGTGSGGPGYKFPDEPVTRPYVRGVVAMANSGSDTNGSQFFILKKDTPLQPNYTIFGQVLSGIEVVDNIKIGDKMTKVTIDSSKTAGP